MAIETLTDIANLALAKIGDKSIADIDTPNSQPASQIKQILQGVIEEVQSDFFWSELTRGVALSANSELDIEERFVYALPLDLLRVYDVDASTFVVEGHAIHTTKEAPLKVYYIKRSENVGEWSTDLKQCVYTLLASELSITLHGNGQKAQYLRSMYETRILPTAKTRQSKDNENIKLRSPNTEAWEDSFAR